MLACDRSCGLWTSVSREMARSKIQFASFSVFRRPGGFLRSDQTRSHPELGRQTLPRQWYCVLRPGRVGRRQACEGRNKFLFESLKWRSGGCALIGFPFRLSLAYSPFTLDAGWSSPVARQAHNLKVTGSNPVPATKSKSPARKRGAFFFSASAVACEEHGNAEHGPCGRFEVIDFAGFVRSRHCFLAIDRNRHEAPMCWAR